MTRSRVATISVGVTLLAIGVAVAALHRKPDEYRFARRYHGVEEATRERKLAESGRPFARVFRFSTPSYDVYEAMAEELLSQNWTYVRDGPFDAITLQNGGRIASFMTPSEYDPIKGGTCIVAIDDDPGWLVREWMAFKDRWSNRSTGQN